MRLETGNSGINSVALQRHDSLYIWIQLVTFVSYKISTTFVTSRNVVSGHRISTDDYKDAVRTVLLARRYIKIFLSLGNRPVRPCRRSISGQP